MLDRAWVGVDVGKEHHWVVAVDADGQVVLSRKVASDERAIVQVLADLGALAEELVWTVDLATVEAALLLAVLLSNGQQVRYRRVGRSTRLRSATGAKARPTPATPE